VSVAARAERPWSVNGVALSKDGSLYLLEPAFVPPSSGTSSRVRKVSPDGKITVLAVVGEKGNQGAGAASDNQPAFNAKAAGAGSRLGALLGVGLGVCVAAAAGLCAWRIRRRQVG
ncbi:MAG TPA: hypothetical protein VF507_03105, partial [Pyrinomonadaceae bacterium]